MRVATLLTAITVMEAAFAWNSITEMESCICMALTNDDYLVSAAFTNQLNSASLSASDEMRAEAYMLLSVSGYRKFLDTADEMWLGQEMSNASNAVVAIGNNSSRWQYWMSRFIFAGAHVSRQDFMHSYLIATNALFEVARLGYSNKVSAVEAAMLKKFEMPRSGIADALKVMAGMSAAELRMGNVATNYANQLSMPYRGVILDFIR